MKHCFDVLLFRLHQIDFRKMYTCIENKRPLDKERANDNQKFLPKVTTFNLHTYRLYHIFHILYSKHDFKQGIVSIEPLGIIEYGTIHNGTEYRLWNVSTWQFKQMRKITKRIISWPLLASALFKHNAIVNTIKSRSYLMIITLESKCISLESEFHVDTKFVEKNWKKKMSRKK